MLLTFGAVADCFLSTDDLLPGLLITGGDGTGSAVSGWAILVHLTPPKHESGEAYGVLRILFGHGGHEKLSDRI